MNSATPSATACSSAGLTTVVPGDCQGSPVDPSVGSVGDAHDALAESTVGLHKTEWISRGPWHSLEHVQIATLEWVDW
jgi:hypothetical protein